LIRGKNESQQLQWAQASTGHLSRGKSMSKFGGHYSNFHTKPEKLWEKGNFSPFSSLRVVGGNFNKNNQIHVLDNNNKLDRLLHVSL
jgi:hypothetical protein